MRTKSRIKVKATYRYINDAMLCSFVKMIRLKNNYFCKRSKPFNRIENSQFFLIRNNGVNLKLGKSVFKNTDTYKDKNVEMEGF